MSSSLAVCRSHNPWPHLSVTSPCDTSISSRDPGRFGSVWLSGYRLCIERFQRFLFFFLSLEGSSEERFLSLSLSQHSSDRKVLFWFLKKKVPALQSVMTVPVLGCCSLPGLVSKCSATLASVAAPALGARPGLGGPNFPRHPTVRGGKSTQKIHPK